MTIGYITRVEHFSSAHRLHSPQLSDEENVLLFGKCNHINGHGHNYKLKITIKGKIDEITGMIVNISDMKIWIKDLVTEVMDHRNLDKDVEYFKNRPSTAENIAVFVWEVLSPKVKLEAPNAQLYEVMLEETERNVVVYRGE